VQRPKFVLIPAVKRLLRLTRLGQHGLGLVIDERIQLGIQALDAIKMSPRHLQRRNFFAADFRCDFQKR